MGPRGRCGVQYQPRCPSLFAWAAIQRLIADSLSKRTTERDVKVSPWRFGQWHAAGGLKHSWLSHTVRSPPPPAPSATRAGGLLSKKVDFLGSTLRAEAPCSWSETHSLDVRILQHGGLGGRLLAGFGAGHPPFGAGHSTPALMAAAELYNVERRVGAPLLVCGVAAAGAPRGAGGPACATASRRHSQDAARRRLLATRFERVHAMGGAAAAEMLTVHYRITRRRGGEGAGQIGLPSTSTVPSFAQLASLSCPSLFFVPLSRSSQPAIFGGRVPQGVPTIRPSIFCASRAAPPDRSPARSI